MRLDGERRAYAFNAPFHERLIDQQSRLGKLIVGEMPGRHVRNALIDKTGGRVRSGSLWPRILLVVAQAASEPGLLTLTLEVIESEVPLVH